MDRFELLQQELTRRCHALELRAEEPMSRHTSFRIGGPAALMAFPKTEEEAVAAVKTAVELGVEPFFLGNGSNLLVPDEGVRRFIIKSAPGMNECTVDGTRITAGSGITLARLAMFARDHGLTGLEFAHGIPGSLGGAVTMNAGAYGGEMAQVIRSVTCLTKEGAVETVREFDFGYRHSAFSDGTRMILRAELELAAGDEGAITARMDELAAQRQAKRRLDVQAPGGLFCRRSHRSVRSEGLHRGRSAGVGKARRVRGEPGRCHLRRRAGAGEAGQGPGLCADGR